MKKVWRLVCAGKMLFAVQSGLLELIGLLLWGGHYVVG